MSAEIYKYGLAPQKEPCSEHFYGLGGTLREAKTRWTFPVGVFGLHAFFSFCEVEGSMPGLIAKSDLKGFGFVWHSTTNTADFIKFELYNQKLIESTGGYTMRSLTDFNPTTVGTDGKFKLFRPHSSDDYYDKAKDTDHNLRKAGAFLSEKLKIASDETVQAAVFDGRAKAALLSAVRRMTMRTVSELAEAFSAVRSTGQTWVWELFAGEHVVTRLATAGGHVGGQPLEFTMVIDRSDEDTVNQVLAAMDEFDPFLVTVGFPCDPWGPLSRLNIGRGYGNTVFAKRDAHWGFICLTAQVLKRQTLRGRLAIAENPWTSSAWGRSPLASLLNEGYVIVRGDQCAFGLRNWMNKILHLKPTGFMVPAGSALETELAKRCTGDHEHTAYAGDGRFSGHQGSRHMAG